ncbi:MAG: hypothetical protein K2Y12_00350 [Chitinophagaceae bacterium]|nr:hypothetical protein [Chitinophagaceae bacterium]
MKTIFLFSALVTIIVLGSCSTTHYVTRPASSGKYYGLSGKHHNDNNRNYSSGHSNRKSRAHHGW